MESRDRWREMAEVLLNTIQEIQLREMIDICQP